MQYSLSIQKTFVDCLFKPEYAGGIPDIARALFFSNDKINYETLLNYTIQFDSQAVIKRLGFLLEVLKMGTSILEDLQNLRTASYVLLDTELPKEGQRNSRWRIQQNIETESIISSIYT